jgi:3-oxoacyl-[acyl-carrier protein] reductase
MDLGFANKVIFISGAGHGIGRAFALAFAEEGAAVTIGEIDPERGNSAAQEIISRAGRALYVPCDVSNSAQVNAAVEKTLAEFGQIDVLVNNAVSPNLTGALEELSDEDWDHNFDVNVKGSFYCSRAVIPHMKERRYGKIVSMASIVGRRGSALPASAAYSASKGGIIGLNATMARELGPYNINVNAIAPGSINTPRWSEARTPEQIDRTVQGTALKRLGEAEDIVGIALMLASDRSSFITGQVVTVDGGMLCM